MTSTTTGTPPRSPGTPSPKRRLASATEHLLRRVRASPLSPGQLAPRVRRRRRGAHDDERRARAGGFGQCSSADSCLSVGWVAGEGAKARALAEAEARRVVALREELAAVQGEGEARDALQKKLRESEAALLAYREREAHALEEVKRRTREIEELDGLCSELEQSELGHSDLGRHSDFDHSEFEPSDLDEL